MLLANRASPTTYQFLLQGLTWQKVFNWIDQILPSLQEQEGEYQILEPDIYANLQKAATIDRSQGVFEAHRTYIDFHYCLEGGEIIEWAPASKLEMNKPYDPSNDSILYRVPPFATSLKMFPGSFAIFFPEDAHMPKISDGINKEVKKVVIKIKSDTL